MTARIGPRLGALLSDLGIPHTANPEPARREHWPAGVAIPTPRTSVEVTLRVDDVDVEALERAGLMDPVVFHTSLGGAIEVRDVPALAEVPGVLTIERTATTRPAIHSSVPATKADYFRSSTPGRTGAGVIVGVVDTGIDIFHHAFRQDNGDTRVVALWDMTAPYTFTAVGTPTGGTFTLNWTAPKATAAETTPALPHTATAAAVLVALEGLPSIDPGDVIVTGGPLPGTPIVVTFVGRYHRQDVEPLRITSSTTPAPTRIRVERGRKYNFGEINAAVRQPESAWGSWDAEGHGTHLAGIAAGDGSQSGNCHLSGYYLGVAPKAELAIVKTTFSAARNIEAVRWIFDTAGAKAAVVNLSFSSEDSAHDGSDQEETEYDNLLAANPIGRSIVASAGNVGALADLSEEGSHPRGGMHSRKAINPSGNATMRFAVREQDAADDWLYVWYGGASRISLQLKEPGGAQLTDSVKPDDAEYTTALAGHPLSIRSETNASTTGRHRIAIRISPRPGPVGTIKPGPWTLTLRETAAVGADVDCWISREDNDRNPRFVNDDQDRMRTIGSPGCGHSVITVANYDHRDNTIAESSSRGPTIDARPDGETKPDLAAPGVGIVAAKGRARGGTCCDCCYDFYVGKSGTSMAVPHVTGVVALMFEADKTLTWDQVRTRLRAGADPPDPITGPTLPNEVWGTGILNAKKALQVPDVHNAVGTGPTAFAGSHLEEMRAAVLATPLGQTAAALVSTHFDEVLRLINARRRVTVAWHRMGGPDLVDHLVHAPSGGPVVLPVAIDGKDLRIGLARLLDALEGEGSLPLRTDVRRHRDLVLRLPGLDLDRADVAG